MKARIQWAGEAMFLGESGSGHVVVMDGPPEAGGRNLGVRPMEMLLLGVGGCSNFDVVSILKKSRQAVESCEAFLEAERATEDPKVFTTIHMQLVRTPMIAPTKIYDSFPTISPEEAADLICEAIRAKPKQINTRLGTFGEVAYALAPKQVDQVLHMAYKVFPDSAASKGKKDESEKASTEQVALAHLMRGVHW